MNRIREYLDNVPGILKLNLDKVESQRALDRETLIGVMLILERLELEWGGSLPSDVEKRMEYIENYVRDNTVSFANQKLDSLNRSIAELDQRVARLEGKGDV